MGNSILLAKTWASNQSGFIWERYWFYDDEVGYFSDCLKNIMTTRKLYKDESEFWAAYDAEQNKYNGEKLYSDTGLLK
jgi:hypothetical protein